MLNKKGFTLIELLVVIAIIGILSSVVLASLNSARQKGADAAIKSNLANVRGQAELLFDTNSAYGVDATPTAFAEAACTNTADTLFADSTIWNQVQAAASAGTGLANTRCLVTANGAAYAVAAQLRTGGTAGDTTPDAWCVDSTGASKSYTYTTGQTIADVIGTSACN